MRVPPSGSLGGFAQGGGAGLFGRGVLGGAGHTLGAGTRDTNREFGVGDGRLDGVDALLLRDQQRPGPDGEDRRLPSGALRLKVYAGIDPVSKHRRYVTETITTGPNAGKEAERALSRLLTRAD